MPMESDTEITHAELDTSELTGAQDASDYEDVAEDCYRRPTVTVTEVPAEEENHDTAKGEDNA